MSTPAPGATSPLRAAGLVLVGLAVVFATLGFLTPGEDTDAGAAPPDSTPTTAAATTTEPSASDPPSSSSAPTSAEPDPAPSTVAPQEPLPSTQADPGGGIAPSPAPGEPAPSTVEPGSADPRTQVGVVVLNNSTISGLAARAAVDVQASGWTVAETGNFAGRISSTTVYYDDGQQLAAQALAADVGARAEPRVGGLPSTAPGIVLVVTQDYAG